MTHIAIVVWVFFMESYKLITDGAYSPKLDQGGLGLVFLKDDKLILEYSKMYKHTTNNQMELLAIISGLKCITNPIDSLIIISDSMYCIGTITKNWKRKKNIKLWNEFDKQYQRVSNLCNDIKFQHVKGHQTDNSKETYWNNYVDKLAVIASQQI